MDAALARFKEKEAQRFKLKAGVFAVVIEDGKVLLLRRYRTGIEDGMYVLPMGGHDGKEPLNKAVIREVKEEIDIHVEEQDVRVCHVMHRLHPMPHGLSFEQLDIFFCVSSYSGTPCNNEPDVCDEVAFFALDALPKNTAPFIKKALECIHKGEFYSEFGWELLTDKE